MSPTETALSRYDQPEMIQTIKQTVAKGASDAQLQMFLAVCKRTGLDPFLKEIWFVAERGIIMAGRDGYLRAANEHPMFDGMETRVERDSNNIPVKAICSVYRKDRSHPITCEAYYSEYKKPGPVWSQYPSAMISKVAEVLALKRSFSINGVVTEEEIGASEERGSKAAQQEVLDRKLREIADNKAKRAAEQAVPLMIEPSQILREELGKALSGVTYEPIPEENFIDPDAPRQSPGLDPPHDQQLIDSLVAFPPKKPKSKLSGQQINVVKEFEPLHERYKAIQMEDRYYEVLNMKPWCKKKSTEFRDIEEAHPCLKYMKLDVAQSEAWAKQPEGA